jgi:hypothetical protein
MKIGAVVGAQAHEYADSKNLSVHSGGDGFPSLLLW